MAPHTKTDSDDRTADSFDSFLKELAFTPAIDQVAEIELATELAGKRFQVRAHVGQGGMGNVWMAWDARDRREVALKTLLSPNPTRIARLKHEFRTFADRRHPNLVELYELHVDTRRWFFTMELVDGIDFCAYVRPAGQLDENRLRTALGQLGAGLAALHQWGLVHRDIKPSNILVEPDGRLVLLDFGLVTQHQPHTPGTERVVMGTVKYMSPEQARERSSRSQVTRGSVSRR